jgi:phospholipase/carboxylesterase
MKTPSLKYLVKEPVTRNKQTALLILLHGYGSNEKDLFSFAAELPENMVIVSAQAIQPLGFESHAWYSLHFDNNDGKFFDIPEALAARETVASFVDEMQDQYAISPQKTFLLGFSQGAILSYAISITYPEKVQKVIALSGYISGELLPENLVENQYQALDFFLSHGSADQVIPVSLARESSPLLSQHKIRHQYKEYPVGHGVSPQNFFDLREWISARM